MIDEVVIPNDWNPRPYQRDIWKYLSKGGKRAVAIWHRRAGKDSMSLNWTAKALFERVGTYWHMLPLNTQARKVVWDAIDKQGRRVIDQVFPVPLRKSVNSQEMKIEFYNGSIWQCVGSDNYNTLVGSNPVGVVFSEYSIADPKAWDFIRPILAENGGWALFIYTPRGKNHGFKLYNEALKADWFVSVQTIEDTKAIGLDVIDEERRAGMPEAMIQQEFYCSFEAMDNEDAKLFKYANVRKATEIKMDSSTSPLIIGVDIARQGDDKTVFCFRKGRYCYKFIELKGFDVVEISDRLTSIINEVHPARIFLDLGNVGAGVYDILKARGYASIIRGVNFGGKAIKNDRYHNKRAEMYGEASNWFNGELPVQIPNDEDFINELFAIPLGHDEYGRLKLVKKDDIKEVLLRSPDKADAFVLTFAEPVYDNGQVRTIGVNNTTIESLFRATESNNSW
jgi:hypothetical protein